MKTSEQVRQAFLDFWSESPRNSKQIANVSLVPNNDPTLLFVNSGMFPLVPYLAGQPHPLGTRIHNVQRCIRTKDIEEVGDNRHLVLFEMIGNWSLGDFGKKEQIPWCLEVYVEKFGLDPKRLYVSVWEGDKTVGRDEEAITLWKEAFKKYGVEAEFSEDITNIPPDLFAGKDWKYRIFPYGKGDNWWQRGETPGELGGPCSEIFYDLGEKERDQDSYHINDDSGRFVEIGNNVFMEYKLDENMNWLPLEQKNIDFGGGFDRIMLAVQNKSDAFSTDLFSTIMEKIGKLTTKTYKSGIEVDADTKAFRVIAEHARSATFILADDIVPSNKDQGYILRRLIRRMVRFGLKLDINQNFTKIIAQAVIDRMQESYPHLKEKKFQILNEIEKEEIKFRKTLVNGLKEFERLHLFKVKKGDNIEREFFPLSGEEGFRLYETFGLPIEMIVEEWQNKNSLAKLTIPEGELERFQFDFEKAKEKHQAASRSGAEQKFKGGLADHSVEVTKLHTAHHLLLRALQQVLGEDVKQRGSNITGERLRIDFNYNEKLTEEEIAKVEAIVNKAIEDNLNIFRTEIVREIAEKIPGIQKEFGLTYPDIVSIYSIGLDKEPSDVGDIAQQFNNAFSVEFCGGPHVKNTGELGAGGKRFRILKEESSGAGIRRIKAALF